MLVELLVLFGILYALQICIFAIGAHRARYSFDSSFRPTVSIIVAARNEEQNIRRCLESLSHLSYPKELLEILVVNDRSTDKTHEIIEEFAVRFPFIQSHTSIPDPDGHLRGKTNAVAQGIERTTGEFIFFTDADCIVPERWVEETVKYYNEPNVGVVAGFTSLRASTLFEAIQALDWFVLFSIAAATIRLHFPVTAVGNNLSVRRKAYEAVGGYRNIPFSITEDYALFHAVMSTGIYKAKFPVDASTLVQSMPCEDWAGLYRQKKRWFIGGADMDLKSIALFATGFLFKTLLVINLLAGNVIAVLAAYAVKVLSDFMLVRPALTTFRKMRLILYFVPFEVYYIVYVVLFPPIVLLNRRVSWKNRVFR
ncbi:MAG: glycosyltransferase [Bacteroidetes bacterium]|nr:glycosyltransferase [Bacteroidota bacterium]MCW5897324.1 glycosyltransferase [Bacteroidota bacterium]